MTMPSLLHLFFSITCLLLLSGSVTAFAKRMKFPPVLGEILLGILIGPTVLGSFAPETSRWLFPIEGEVGAALRTLAQMAVLLLLLVAGLETNLKALRTEGGLILSTAFGSALVPFVAGFCLVWLCPAVFGGMPEHPWLLSLFVGIALAISALPVIIRILMDLNLFRSRIGMVTVAAASIMDLMGWIAFTLILSCWSAVSLQESIHSFWSHLTLLSFLVGIALGNSARLSPKICQCARKFVIPVVSPLFFLSIGVKLNFASHLDFALASVIVLVATGSKVLGTFLGGRLGGLGGKDALAVGFALNARGAMEMILAQQALEAGLIQPHLFVGLVIMALLTSLLSAPALKYLMMNQPDKGNQDASPLKAKAEHVLAG
jgi:Kef-type K+ transport system membrane component KefB